jgi:hypothetical protein
LPREVFLGGGVWQRSLRSPGHPVEGRSTRKAEGGRQRVDHKVLHPCVPTGHQELQHFDQAGEADNEGCRERPVAGVGQSESEPQQQKGKCVLSVLSKV